MVCKKSKPEDKISNIFDQTNEGKSQNKLISIKNFDSKKKNSKNNDSDSKSESNSNNSDSKSEDSIDREAMQELSLEKNKKESLKSIKSKNSRETDDNNKPAKNDQKNIDENKDSVKRKRDKTSGQHLKYDMSNFEN